MNSEEQQDWFHELERYSICLTENQQTQFSVYETLLIDWNQRMNLTRIIEPQAIRIRHFFDSLTVAALSHWQPTSRSLVDVGTGAGFPGVALAIVFPELAVTLVESVQKKTTFLQALVNELGLDNVNVVTQRAEDAGRIPHLRESFDYAVARSVARLPVLLEYLLPFVKVGGRAIAWKGETAQTEINDATSALQTLGAENSPEICTVQLPTVEQQHALISVLKTSATPEQFPRRAGKPAKSPL